MSTGDGGTQAGAGGAAKKRRRGSRGGRNRSSGGTAQRSSSDTRRPSDDVDMPDVPNEGRVTNPNVAAAAVVRRPQIGDSRPGRIPPPPYTTRLFLVKYFRVSFSVVSASGFRSMAS